MILLGEAGGLATTLAGALEKEGFRAEVVDPGLDFDIMSLESMAEGLQKIFGSGNPIGGFLRLDAVKSFPRMTAMATAERQDWIARHVRGTFHLARFFFNHFKAEKEKPFFWVAADLGGDFGVHRDREYCAGGGGLAGFIKSLKKEIPEARLKFLDLPAAEGPEKNAAHLCEEILAGDPGVEVAYRLGRRFALTPVPVDLSGDTQGLEFDEGDLVLVSGGARGITAGIVRAMAERWRTRFLLLGRSATAVPELESLLAHVPENQWKGVLFQDLKKKNPSTTPKDVEKAIDRVRQAAEIRRTQDEVRATGSQVFYEMLDCNHAGEVKKRLGEFQRKHGRVTAFIHGAGVLQDRLVVDKTPEQFKAVLDTKVEGFFNIFDVIKENDLKLVSPFTSVAGKFGNRGQSDYAAANEILNHVCLCDGRLWPNTRFLAVNWGPWAGGMVTATLARVFESQGIGLIPLAGGARMYVDELAFGGGEIAEIIVGAEKLELGGSIGRRSFSRDRILDVREAPFLKDHCLKDLPVLPVVYVFELFHDLASELFPRLAVREVRGLQVVAGVSFDEDRKVFQAEIQEIDPGFGCEVTLAVTLASRKKGQEKLTRNYTGTIDLGREPAPVPPFQIPADLASGEYPLNLTEMYRKHLFHGPLLKAITRVRGISEKGIVAVLKTSNPAIFLTRPGRDRWHTDPLVLDGMAQMGLVFLGHHRGHIGIPVFFESYCQFRPFDGQEVTCYAETKKLDYKTFEIVMDCLFLDDRGRLIAKGTGWKSIFHPSFNSYTTAAKEA